ncbi:MAG: transporter substrate-binding domain-containing protein [Gammaproteobacteria bacterium]|nr:transporter substrate-binding domain-containing protein [Gammaproteobacteria bacterium]
MKLTRYICSGVAGLAALFAVAAASAEPLKVGIAAEPYPPFTYKSADGSWTGFEVELADAICARIERDCQITPTAWSGIIPALNSGKIDVIMTSMSITEERDKVIDFTDPYYNTLGAYVARKDLDIEFPDGLDGRILGVQAATTHASFARDALTDTGVEVKIYDQQEQANRDLLSGRVDVILADQIAMAEFVERDEVADFEIKGMAPRHPAFGDGIGIGLREDEGDLQSTLNEAIGAVLGDGTCTELSEKYFGQDICGG